jgi:type IV secretion system protein VirB11
MVMRFGSTLQRAEIIDYARSLIDVVVQMHRYDDGVRGISKVLYVPH